MPPRRVCFFTGSRADYGPMRPFMTRLRDDPGIDLRVLAGGGHLVPEQGYTVDAIEADGFRVDDRIEIVLASDAPAGMSKSLGLACIGFADALRRISPELLIVPGDRYEALAAAVAALPTLIPIVHVGGGQLSHGSLDDQMRHAITKLAHLHFVVTADDRRRVVQLGEDPARVHQVGMIGLDPAVLANLLDETALQQRLGIPLRRPTFLITYHPATASTADSVHAVDELLRAVDDHPDASFVFTAPNVDGAGRAIISRIREYAVEHDDRGTFVASLGQVNYLSLLKWADAVIGNSSSGINEAPILGTPTVNIGPRQDGRGRAPSIVDCAESAAAISNAIKLALDMRCDDRDLEQIDDIDRSLDRMVQIIKDVDLDELRIKRFFEFTAS